MNKNKGIKLVVKESLTTRTNIPV